ncbi:MAG: DUF4115 domain-containing protein, partial [Kangiellaceae bacterium]|nr:DUF4115 domain-containing protein [Kangiellaceae bacterium]
ISYLIVLSLLSFAGWEVWKRFGPTSQQNEPESNSIQLNTSPSSESELNSTAKGLSESQINQVEELPRPNESDDVQNISLEAKSAQQKSEEGTSQGAELNNREETVVNSINESQPQTVEQNIEQAQGEVDFSSGVNEQVSAIKTEPVIDTEFVFTGDCWVQVKDANGEVIAVGVKKSGKIMPLTGVAPFDVILGEPSVVKITLNGEEFDLSSFGPGQTAKFVLQ